MASKELTPRTVPCRVICLGLCRTGTMSLKQALIELGYGPVYHMSEVIQAPTDGPAIWWNEALKAKFERGVAPTLAEWDDILGKYQSVTDIPAACFAPELIAAYPDAKIILTTRSAESWYKSMMNTIVKYAFHPKQHFILLFSSRLPRHAMICTLFEAYFYNDFPRYGARVMNDHNEMVRRVAPPERFLDYEVKQGWGPLCEFLGEQIPDKAFPNINDTESFQKNLSRRLEMRFRGALLKAFVFVVLPTLAVGGGYLWRSGVLRKTLKT